MSRLVVVDADVFAAASETSVRGIACAQVMRAILEICHRAAVSPALMEEWKNHRSRFSNRWLNQMFGRRKVERLVGLENTALRASGTCQRG